MNKIKQILSDAKIRPFINIGLFITITISIHFLYRYWARMDYAPINQQMHSLHLWFADMVYRQSAWLIQHLLGMDIKLIGNTMYWPNQQWIAITEGCSGVKQIIQFALLMLIFPGPWRKKLWYIPMGMLIIYLVNIFRILVLAEVLVHAPTYWHFTHDNIVRPFFYVVIFALWVWWTEKLQTTEK